MSPLPPKERAMSVLPRSRLKPAIVFIFVTAVLDIMAMGVVIPVLPALVEEFTGSNAKAGIYNGLFVTLWAGMQFIFSPVIGSLSDRYGRRPVILISTAGLAADFALMALAPEPVVAGGGAHPRRDNLVQLHDRIRLYGRPPPARGPPPRLRPDAPRRRRPLPLRAACRGRPRPLGPAA